MLDRSEACKRIRVALKRKTGKTWSVTGGRGTAWGWLTVAAPPKRRVCHAQNPRWEAWDMTSQEPSYFERQPEEGETAYYTSDADARLITKAFKLNRKVHFQGLQISPDEWEFYVQRAEA